MSKRAYAKELADGQRYLDGAAEIRSHLATDEYRSGWDYVFKRWGCAFCSFVGNRGEMYDHVTATHSSIGAMAMRDLDQEQPNV